MKKVVRLGTRGSELALWQTEWVKSKLSGEFPDVEFDILVIQTTGDKILDSPLSKIGDKGFFTKELDRALLDDQIDIAVHSMKDVPTQYDENLAIASVTERWDARDALISPSGKLLDELPNGAVVATGSLRRRSQLLHYRQDLQIVDIRGNINTRLRKLDQSSWDALILASAGIERLNLHTRITQKIPVEIMLPAVGQGCLAVMTKKSNMEIINMLAVIHQPLVVCAIFAERAFLRTLEGGCQVPVGALGETDGNSGKLKGCVASLDGSNYFSDEVQFSFDEPDEAGVELAERLIRAGAKEVLEEIRKGTTNQ